MLYKLLILLKVAMDGKEEEGRIDVNQGHIAQMLYCGSQ